MVSHLAPVLYNFGVHLLYASMVWIAAWVLTSIPLGSPTIKYWIWLATSLNFVLPFGALFDKLFASHLTFAKPLGFIGGVGVEIAENHRVAAVLATVWLIGAGVMATRLYLRLRSERRDFRSCDPRESRRSFVAEGIPVTFGRSQAPVVDGVLYPQISLPDGMDELLSEHELTAVLLHELKHAKRRDNLIRLAHEIVLCVLWFHPVVWIANSRLCLYRELSCDESVIKHAHGADLVSALSKLANPEEPLLLHSTASSFLSVRLAHLVEGQPQQKWGTANALLGAVFGSVLAGGIFATVAHTACCFMAKK